MCLREVMFGPEAQTNSTVRSRTIVAENNFLKRVQTWSSETFAGRGFNARFLLPLQQNQTKSMKRKCSVIFNLRIDLDAHLHGFTFSSSSVNPTRLPDEEGMSLNRVNLAIIMGFRHPNPLPSPPAQP